MIGRCMVNKDPYPQWRRLCWSKYSDMLACSDSSGNVQIFDLVGTWLCTIPSPAVSYQTKHYTSYVNKVILIPWRDPLWPSSYDAWLPILGSLV